MNRRQKQLVSTTVSVTLALLCYFLVLAVSNDNQKSFDLTSEGRFSFSQQTNDIVGKLDTPVKLYAFLDPNGDSSPVENMLERYRRLNGKNFSYEVVDLERKPTLAESLEVRAYGQGVLERVEKGADGKPPRRERVLSFDEATLTGALQKLTTRESQKVGFLTGHGERAILGGDKDSLSTMAAALGTEGYTTEAVKLANGGAIPKDLAVLVLGGPTSSLLAGERALIDSYLKAGGKMLFLADIATPASYGQWLKGYGFVMGESVIIDTKSQMVGAEPVFAVGVGYSATHPITSKFADLTAFRLGRPVDVGPVTSITDGAAPTLEVLVRTNKSAFLLPIAKVLSSATVSFSAEGKEAASYPLAAAGLYPMKSEDSAPAAATPTPAGKEEAAPQAPELSTRISVIGSVDSFSDRLFAFVSNRDFVLNTVNWLATSENQITVRTKNHKSQPIILEKQKEKWLNFLFCILLPFLSMLTGFLIASQRRRGLGS